MIRVLGLILPLAAALLLASPAAAAWPGDPAANLMLGGGPGEQVVPHLAVVPPGGDHAGHVYVGWYDNASGNYDVALHHLDASGEPVFPPGGLMVSTHPQDSWVMDWGLAVDAAGNAHVAFADIRDGDSNIHVYKISPAGDFLWGPDGVALTADSDFKGPPTVGVAADGDAVVVWMESGAQTEMRMQRLAPDGTLRLAPGGVVVSEAGDLSPAEYLLVPTGPSDVILGYVPTYSFMGNRQIKAQRFDATAAPVWPAAVMVMDDSTLPMGHDFAMDPDGEGGALFCWNIAAGLAFGSRVQRLDADGNELLPHNGVSAAADGASGQIEPAAVYDPATGAITMVYASMNSAQSQRGLRAQRIDAAGQRLWGSQGSELLPLDGDLEGQPCLVLHQGAILGTVIHNPGGAYATDVLLGFRLDDTGGLAWPGGFVDLASTPSAKSRPSLAANGATAVAVWVDERDGTPDVYAQNLNDDGSLGGITVAAPGQTVVPARGPVTLHPAAPNPFNPRTVIAFDLAQAARVRVQIHDLAGRLVRELVHADLAADRHEVAWDGTDAGGRVLPSGVYLCRVITPAATAARALTLVR